MDVEQFLARLSAQTAPTNRGSFKPKDRVLEKISLNFEGNFGRYMVLPVNSVILDYPFMKMAGTREICVPRKNVAQDGTVSTYTAWIKLLPKEAYQFLDVNNRITSSLTAENDKILSEAYMVFDQLYNEIDARNAQSLSKNLMRKRNYTIFNAFCANFWSGNSREPKRQNFCGLFVSTASGFMNAIEDNITSNSVLTPDTSWINQVYSRQPSGRTGYLLFSIGRNPNAAGYLVNAEHKFDCGSQLANITIPEDQLELMQNPILNFLGWQASREDENLPIANRRLFNAALIKEAIAYMTQQLSAVRAAKENNMSLEEAIKNTSERVAKEGNSNYVAPEKPVATNDPMLGGQQQKTFGAPAISQEEVMARNTNPYQTPAAAQMDPITGSPVGSNNNNNGFGGFNGGFGSQPQQSAPFIQPDFAKFNGGGSQTEGDLPF